MKLVGVGAQCQGVISVLVIELSSGRKIGTVCTSTCAFYTHILRGFPFFGFGLTNSGRVRLKCHSLGHTNTQSENHGKNIYKHTGTCAARLGIKL